MNDQEYDAFLGWWKYTSPQILHQLSNGDVSAERLAAIAWTAGNINQQIQAEKAQQCNAQPPATSAN